VGQPRGPADGAEKNRVEAADGREKIFRCDATVPVVVPHAPVEALAREAELAATFRRGLEHRDGGIDDLGTDAVARVKRDAMGFHAREITGGAARGAISVA